MENTSNKEVTFDSLDDVLSYCNTEIEMTRASIIKTLREKLIGKYFVRRYSTHKARWTYFGKITRLDIRKGTFKEVILEYENRYGIFEVETFLIGSYPENMAQFFDDQNSAMLFAEAAN